MKVADSFSQVVAANETHGIERAAVGILPQPVNGHNARMLQLACDLCLKEKAVPADRVLRVALLDLLERHFAVQFLVLGYKNLPYAALGVRSQNPITHHSWSAFGRSQDV